MTTTSNTATRNATPTNTTAIRMRAKVDRVRRRRQQLLALKISVPVIVVVAWFFGSLGSTNPFFPPLIDILVEFKNLWLFDHFVSDIVPSVSNFVLAYLIACAIGIAVGILIALVKQLYWMIDPLIQFIRAIPAVALLPIFLAVLGFGNEVRIFAIVFGSLFPVLISTADGVRSVEPLLLDLARVYRFTKWDKLRRIYIPGALPHIFSGAVVSLQVAFIVMITSEMLGSARGIGAMTLLAEKSLEVRAMWAGILLLGILGFLANLVFELVRRRVLAWHFGAQKAALSD